MPTRIWLTDEDSDIEGYKRAKVGFKSDCISLVRAETLTTVGPDEVPITRRTGTSGLFGAGTELKWITDPLGGPSLEEVAWEMHAWCKVSDAAANATISMQVLRYTIDESSSVVSASSTILSTGIRDIALTTGDAVATNFDYGDRLVFKVSVTDAPDVQMVAGYTVTFSYNGLFRRAEGDTFFETSDEISIITDIPNDDVSMVRSLLRDQGIENPQLVDEDIKKFITMALNTYSVNRPLVISTYMVGDGHSFDYPLPGKWVWGLSRITGIEQPADQQLPTYIEQVDYEVREGSLGPQPTKFIRFKLSTPSENENSWVQYTTRHHHSTEYSSIAPEDFEAVIWLACYHACVALAAGAASSTESTLNADVVNHRDATQRWRDVGDMFKAMYEDRIISPESSTPAGFTVDWDSFLSSGMPYLWHGRRVRRVR